MVKIDPLKNIMITTEDTSKIEEAAINRIDLDKVVTIIKGDIKGPQKLKKKQIG